MNASVFDLRLDRDINWRSSGDLLVIGNPPWVTSAELNRMGSSNIPKKQNIKGARGLDALLGSSNFDVCEYIILKVLTELNSAPMHLGMLCKTQVARNVVEFAHSSRLPVISADVYRINASEWFGAGVDACWLVMNIDHRRPPNYIAALHEDLDTIELEPTRFGIVDKRMVSDVHKYEAVRVADTRCPYEWRSGLKHDASAVYELAAAPEPVTRSGHRPDIEWDFIYPLLKSTDVFRGRHRELSKWVVVPQLAFGADTSHLQHTAPNLWAYLAANGSALDARKSSIYRNRPRFSVFGHGPYTYAPYKVAISGLHKSPVFRLIAPIEGKPVVLDDTCYFIPFDAAEDALAVWAILSTTSCADLIESLAFWDSKRPITKKLLARIGIQNLPVDRKQVLDAALDEAARAGINVDHLSISGGLARALAPEAPVLFLR